MLRPLLLATFATVTSFATALPATATPAGAAGVFGPLPPLPLLSSPDTLTVSIERSGHADADGTFELECGGTPGGTHPVAEKACKRLDQFAQAGENPFAPVPEDRMCTQQHGGPATAHITGSWRGRTIDAHFSRADGCEIDRWENLRPVLPRVKG
ncbi:SSI family serine proteinase inhibitor [Streptomyces sp. NPDC006339]|uniref:SSI family serine proteinase inhibitor n=1 Tax=Streptomyces sp. NPDC006339 TaxID=3156755 RepID=UPI0033B56933